MSDFAWAIIGPGGIAQRFADAVFQMPGTHLHSVLGRDPTRTGDFVRHWTRAGKPRPRVVTELAALLDDEAIDAVYIATPNSEHGAFIRQCLLAGKPVLCEKPLVPSASVARELVALSQQRGVFLMEAMWTRFLPIYEQVRVWLASGAIGSLQSMQSSFCVNVPFDPQSRLFSAALGGGSLLDIGIYNIAMSRWVLEAAQGVCPAPVRMNASGTLAPTGVDQRAIGTMVFGDGVVSQFVCAFDGVADNALRIFGSEGSICLPHNFWEATQASLTPREGPVQLAHAPFRINGFEGEIDEAMRCVRAGLVQSPRMPHAETLAIVECLDEFRRQLGVRYPFEVAAP